MADEAEEKGYKSMDDVGRTVTRTSKSEQREGEMQDNNAKHQIKPSSWWRRSGIWDLASPLIPQKKKPRMKIHTEHRTGVKTHRREK